MASMTAWKLTAERFGDLLSVTETGQPSLSFDVTDTGTGRTTVVNGELTIATNLYGSVTGKRYARGITETRTLNSDGTLQSLSVGECSHSGWDATAREK